MAAPAKKEAPSNGVTDIGYKPKGAAVFNLPVESPFVYRWNPEQWELVEVGGRPVLVPALSKLVLTAGVNGVLATRKGDMSLAGRTFEEVEETAVKASEREGWRHINPHAVVNAPFLPAGVEAGPLRRMTRVLAGERWHDAFETHVPSIAGPARTLYARDRLYAWLAAQATQDAFGTPPPDVLLGLRAQLQAQYDRLESRFAAVTEEIRNRRLAPVRAQLAALDEVGKPKDAPQEVASA